MTNERVLLLLGSNSGDKLNNLDRAKNLITERVGPILKEGEVVETEPVEFTSDSNFLNQLILIETAYSPVHLLIIIKEIEFEMGRIYVLPKPGEKYSSRLIDIDILRYDELKFTSEKLQIPHVQIHTRDFVKNMLISFPGF